MIKESVVIHQVKLTCLIYYKLIQRNYEFHIPVRVVLRFPMQ